MSVEIVPLRTPDQFRLTIDIQRAVWGLCDVELMSPAGFACTVDTGGQVFGAMDGTRMVAFLVAVPALKPDGRIFLFSVALAVLAEYRSRGIGRALKLAQRQDALARGIDVIEWTFDPLRARNAWFNIGLLGAVIRTYKPNREAAASNVLQGSLPGDRVVATWRLRSARAEAAASGCPPEKGPAAATINVPAGLDALRNDDPEQALRIQTQIREQFLAHIGRGLAATGFERGQRGGTYLLEPWPSE